MRVYTRVLEMDPAQAERIIFLTGGAFTPKAFSFLEAVPNVRWRSRST